MIMIVADNKATHFPLIPHLEDPRGSVNVPPKLCGFPHFVPHFCRGNVSPSLAKLILIFLLPINGEDGWAEVPVR